MNITRRKTRRRANDETEGGDLSISFKDVHNVAAKAKGSGEYETANG